MIERVPCRSAHCKARSPRKAIPAARDENFLAGHCPQLRKELFPNRSFLLSHMGRIRLSKRGPKRREVHPLGLQQVQAYCAGRSPSLRFPVVEVGWNALQHIIEGGPAGCEKTDVSLNIPLLERLEIGAEKNTGCPEVSRRSIEGGGTKVRPARSATRAKRKPAVKRWFNVVASSLPTRHHPIHSSA